MAMLVVVIVVMMNVELGVYVIIVTCLPRIMCNVHCTMYAYMYTYHIVQGTIYPIYYIAIRNSNTQYGSSSIQCKLFPKSYINIITIFGEIANGNLILMIMMIMMLFNDGFNRRFNNV